MSPRLSPAEQGALRVFRERVAAVAGDNVLRFVLFGSRARGEGHELSDLDVLVVVRKYDAAERRRIIDVAADVDDETGLILSPVVLDEEQLAASHALNAAVARDGVAL